MADGQQPSEGPDPEALDSVEEAVATCSQSMWEVQCSVPRTTSGWLNHEEHRPLGISLHACGWPPGSDREER